jgi:hypothetical protein
MIRELSSKVLEFGGPATHTRCFLHTVNLVAKSLIREFDMKKQEAEEALAHSTDMELEEFSAEMEEDAGPGVTDEVDNDDGFVDEVELLDENERVTLNKEIRPVKLALAKVSAHNKRKLTVELNLCPSCASTHTRSYIRLLSSFPHGMASSRICRNPKRSCHVMWPHDGIRRSICWTMHLIIERP